MREPSVRTRLEITLFGTFYMLGALHLTRQCIRAGVSAYGQKQWHQMVSDIALGQGGKKLAVEVSHTIGQPIPVVYRVRGMALHDRGFGMEVFHGGHFRPLDAVEAGNRALQPSVLMQEYAQHDMLAVFWAKRDGAMFFRWDGVDVLNPADVVMVYDSLAPLLAAKTGFDLVLDVTWQGRKGRRKGQDTDGSFHGHGHVFHKVT